MEWPDPPERTVNPALPVPPDQTVQLAPPALLVLRAQMALPVWAALQGPRVLRARPVPRELRVDPETANVFAPKKRGKPDETKHSGSD